MDKLWNIIGFSNKYVQKLTPLTPDDLCYHHIQQQSNKSNKDGKNQSTSQLDLWDPSYVCFINHFVYE